MGMIEITPGISLDEDDLEWQAIRAQGAGGQNVNKVSSALHLRLDIHKAKLPEALKKRLLQISDRRINNAGVLVIKAQTHRTQEKNRAEALERLRELLLKASHVQKKRRPTKPSRSSQRKRMDSKSKHGKLKRLRRTLDD